MNLVELSIPPGVRVSGTERGSRGAWIDASLIRWNPDLQPIGGWAVKSTSAVTGHGRTILTWRDNDANNWTVVGTSEGLFVMTASGVVHDITPDGFTPGRDDAIVGGGYGAGLYGTGLYGTVRTGSSNVNPASVWTLALWNDRLVGCMAEDGKLYEWALNTSLPAYQIDGSPEDCTGLVVTEDAILMAFRGRTVIWSNQGDNTDWDPTSLNQAGDLALNTDGLIVCGRKVRGQTLIFTDDDLWAATYQGPPAVYGFQKVGDSCGAVSKGAPVPYGTGNCAWMSNKNFYLFNGYTQDIPCPVWERVFNDINAEQISKVTGWHNSQFNEIWWHYPSADSLENDRYVYWNYSTNIWGIGAMNRLCGDGSSSPYLVGHDGYVYRHEYGDNYDDVLPYAKTGPFEWPTDGGYGGKRVRAGGLVPDEKTLGQTQFFFDLREFPNLPATTTDTYTITGAPVDFMWTTRQAEMTVQFLDSGGRWGFPRLYADPISSR